MSKDNLRLECGLFILFSEADPGIGLFIFYHSQERVGHRLRVLSEARPPRRVGFVWPGHVAGGVSPGVVQLPLRGQPGL